MATPGVDFFRVDRSGRTRRLLVAGVIMVTLGASSVGAHLVRRLPEAVSHAVSLAGGVCMLAGLLMSFGSMASMLFEDAYVVIRDRELVFHDNGREVMVTWDDLAGVHVDAKTGFLEVKRREGDPVRWYAGRPASEIAARIEEAKRKALHGLLKIGAP